MPLASVLLGDAPAALLASVLLGGGVLEIAVPVELRDAGAGHLAEMLPAVLEVVVAFL